MIFNKRVTVWDDSVRYYVYNAYILYVLSVEGCCTSVGFMGFVDSTKKVLAEAPRNRRDQAGSPSCMKPAMEKGVVSWLLVHLSI